MNDDCLFCKIIDRKIPAKVVYENDEILAFEDIKPQAPTHVLIIPKEHVENVSEINSKNMYLIGKMMLTAKDLAAKKGVEKSGYRIVLNSNKDAGQEVYHLHAHLLGGRKFGWPPG